jgi:hypothetical protein
MLFVWTASSGWAATALLCGGIAIPYFVRSTRAAERSIRARLRPHYWIGMLVPAVSFVHAWLPMAAGRMRGLDPTGLALATMALLTMLGQVALGVSLRQSTGLVHRTTKRVHFWTMVALASLILAHILLNRV